MKDEKPTAAHREPIFEGVGTAIITPMKQGEIDYTSLRELIRLQLTNGIDAIIVGGTTGEAATLSETERYTLYERSIEMIGGKAKVILGTGTNDTRVALAHTKFAADIGADAALVVTPYYNKGTEEGIFRHYATIAGGADIPLILYNVPSRTGVNLGIGILRRLSQIPSVRGIKEAGDSLDRLAALAELNECEPCSEAKIEGDREGDTVTDNKGVGRSSGQYRRLPIYAGNDSQILPALALGASGVISVVSNLFPRETSALYRAFREGELVEARRIQLSLLPFIRAIFLETNPAPIKCALAMLELSSEELRLPLAPVRESTRSAILAALRPLLRGRALPG